MMNGTTILLNIKNASFDILSNEEIIKLYLVRMVEVIGMTPVLETLLIKHFPVPIKGKLSGDFGISGMMILVESHISIHTWPELYYARVEISTCKKIDEDQVQKIIDFNTFIFGIDTDIDLQLVDWFTEPIT